MLNELIRLLGAPLICPSVEISGVTHDSRNVKPGDIYIAVKGSQHDGHDFISTAVKSGAAAIIVDQSRKSCLLEDGIPGWSVPNTRHVMGDVADIVYNHPTSKLHVVGVTGTNGKTSTTHIIAHLAKGIFSKTGTIGTLGAFASGVTVPGQRTTPEAPELQQIFSQMVTHSVGAVAIEVASHALVHGRVNGCLFDAAVFTNLTQDHLDFHGDMETYFQAKTLLFTDHLLRSVTIGKQPFAVVGLDTNWGAKLRQLTHGTTTYTFSCDANTSADFVASNVNLLSSSTEFDVLHLGKLRRVHLPLGGAFQVENALAALTWFVGAGGALDAGIELLRSCPQIPGRFEVVPSKQLFDVVVDYAHTPDGLENVLSTARTLCTGELICVFGCGGDRDRSKRPQMGAIAEKYSDSVIVTSDNPRTENPDAIIDEIVAGMTEACKVTVESDRRAAIALAVQSAKPNGLVVIAGKGHENYQIVGNLVFPFDDCDVASEELAKCS
jgi:UDP-N-acetylmuramoyl-L-alanyl-D-glutamate--2,6-diaminopimelate ligase